MEAATITLRDGDIYRWSYRAHGDDGQWGRYHCCSRIAIVHGGTLRDTYWMIGNLFPGCDGRTFGPEDLHKINLTLLGNLADLEKAQEWNRSFAKGKRGMRKKARRAKR